MTYRLPSRSELRREACNKTVNEKLPALSKSTGPLGLISPYSSFTANVADLVSTPDSESVILPDIITGTIRPFGGHKISSLAASVIAGGAVSVALRRTPAKL